MSYELFRTDLFTSLMDILPQEKLAEVMNAVDVAAQGYEFERKNTSLTVFLPIPEPLKMYIASKATENLSKATLKNYYYLLVKFFSYVKKPFDSITTNDVRNFLLAYKASRQISDRTLEQIRVYIHCFYDWCVNEGLLFRNPVNLIHAIRYQAKERYVISPLELERMRFNCVTLREKAIIDVLYSSGLRVTELCRLKKEDIDLGARTIHVKQGKGNKDRTTYINAEAVISLTAYLNSRSDTCPYVIVNINGEKHMVNKRTIESEVRKVAERAGLSTEKISPHNFRHTFATTLIRNGCPIEHVQKMLGHSKLSTTMIYARIDDEDVRRNHERCAI